MSISPKLVLSHALVAFLTIVICLFGPSNRVSDLAQKRASLVTDGDARSAIARTGDSTVRDKRLRESAPAAGKSTAHQLPSEVEVNPDGSVIVPSSLISRITFHPLNHDFSINFEELRLMGIDMISGEKLNEFIEGLSLETINEESKNYKVISEEKDEVTLLIPSNPSTVQAETSKMKNVLSSIVGNKADLVEASMYGQLSHLTAGFGAHDRLVHLKLEDDGTSSYEVIELLPESTKILVDSKAKIDDFKRVALKVSKFKAEKVPDRLKHLFVN